MERPAVLKRRDGRGALRCGFEWPAPEGSVWINVSGGEATAHGILDHLMADPPPRGEQPRVERHQLCVELRDLGLAGIDIAKLLGLGSSTVYDLFEDPDGSRARARKAKNDGICADCGGPTKSGGERTPPKRCASCAVKWAEANKHWTPENIDAAIQHYVQRYGVAPAATAWLKADRGADSDDDYIYPPASTLIQEGGWSFCVRRAGFKPHREIGKGSVPHLTPEVLAHTIEVYDNSATLQEAGEKLGISGPAVRLRLVKAGHPLKPHPQKRGFTPVQTPDQVLERETDRLQEKRRRLVEEIEKVDVDLAKWRIVSDAFTAHDQQRDPTP